VSNLCLILLANPHASFVAGFKAWLELGYCVRKGEHAIWIFAPMPTRRHNSDPAAETDEEQGRVLFRAVPVFDTLSRDR
jgi:antirestriction factor ArdC-like protein